MIRFDLAVANYNKAAIFWEGFANVQNFDPVLDRVVFLDCSNDPNAELATCLHYLQRYGLNEANFVFIKRRNWLLNPGAMLDYVRLVGEGYLKAPLHTYFMQDHFINKTMLVKGDTIPDETVLDLDRISSLLLEDNTLAVCATRYGFRLCASVPEEQCGENYVPCDTLQQHLWLLLDHAAPRDAIINGKYCNDHFIYYDGSFHMEGSQDICLVVDGCNICVDPKYYVNHYLENKGLYSRGIGDYGDGLTWEARLSKILADQGVGFYELSRNVCVRSPEELKKLQPDPDYRKLWCYFYNSPLFYWIHGQDIWPYHFKNNEAYLRYAEFCVNHLKKVDSNDSLQVIYDPKTFVRHP